MEVGLLRRGMVGTKLTMHGKVGAIEANYGGWLREKEVLLIAVRLTVGRKVLRLTFIYVSNLAFVTEIG